MRFPKNLTTTMGIELTFMPEIAEFMLAELGPNMFSAEYANQGFLSECLKKILNKRKVPFYQCGTDPAVVEVPTQPYDNGHELRDVVRNIYEAASDVGLSPVATWTIGGGAHIHTGVIGKTEEEQQAYKAHMAAFVARNPWLCWAFAGYTDQKNAKPLTMKHIKSPVRPRTIADDMAECREEMQENARYMEEIRRHLIRYTNTLHAQQQSERMVRELNREIAYCRRSLNNYRKQITAYLKRYEKLVAEQDAAKVAPPITDDAYPVERVALPQSKGYVAVDRCRTIEFRAFRMTEHPDDMAKLVRLADKLCALAAKAAKKSPKAVNIAGAYEGQAMKYSEQRRGFAAMLEGLGLDPEQYREFRVNMAVRLRHEGGRATPWCKERARAQAEEVARWRAQRAAPLMPQGRHNPPAFRGLRAPVRRWEPVWNMAA